SRVFRKSASECVDAIAYVLCRRLEIAIEFKCRDYDRSSLAANRSQFADAVDCVDDLFDRLGDERLDLFGRGTGKIHTHGNGRKINGRKAIDTQPEETR